MCAAAGISILVLSACDASFVATEPFVDAELRVIVTLSRLSQTERNSVKVLAGDAPFHLSLESVFESQAHADIWVFAYSREEIVTAYPALAGKSAEEIAELLSPRLGVPDVLPPVPREVARASVVQDGPKDVQYEKVAWADWQAQVDSKNAPGFGFYPDDPNVLDPCEKIKITPVSVTSTVPLFRVRIIDANTALAFGPIMRPASSATPMTILRVENEAVMQLPADARLLGNLSSVARTTEDSMIIVGRQVMQIDNRGLAMDPPSFSQPFHVSGVTSGVADTVYFYGPDGIAELTSGATIAVHRQDYTWALNDLAAPRPDLMVAAEHSRQSLRVFDGSSWKVEYMQDAFGPDLNLARGRENTVAYGTFQVALLRDHDGRWNTLPEPFRGALHYRDVADLGAGRFIAVASTTLMRPIRSGAAAIWLGDAWCVLPIEESKGLFGVDVSPDRRWAYIVGDAGGVAKGAPAFYRLDLPEYFR